MAPDTNPDSNRSFQVAVAGGELTVHELAGSADSQHTLITLHGITANGLSIRPFAHAVDSSTSGRFRVLAPDLAGRACSNAVTGPWGWGGTPTSCSLP